MPPSVESVFFPKTPAASLPRHSRLLHLSFLPIRPATATPCRLSRCRPNPDALPAAAVSPQAPHPVGCSGVAPGPTSFGPCSSPALPEGIREQI